LAVWLALPAQAEARSAATQAIKWLIVPGLASYLLEQSSCWEFLRKEVGSDETNGT